MGEKKLDLKMQILQNNPKIDMKVVDSFDKAQKNNPKFFKSSYSIQSPFAVVTPDRPLFNSSKK